MCPWCSWGCLWSAARDVLVFRTWRPLTLQVGVGFEGVSTVSASGCCLQPLGEQAGGFHRAGFFPGRGEPQTGFGVLELATFPKRLGGSHWTVTSGGLRRDQPRAGVARGGGFL